MDAPRIWTRRPRILELRDPFILRPTIQGFYRLRTIRPDGSVNRDTGEFPNLITNSGLDAAGGSHGGPSLTNYRVGTGNATPTVTDTALVAQVAQTTGGGAQVASTTLANQGADHYVQTSSTARFSPPGVSHNLQECAVAGASGQPVASRALIVDGNGDPVTLPWAADESLDMTYILRAYPPAADVDTTMVVSGVEYDIRIRQANAGAWLLTGYNPSGSAYNGLSAVSDSPVTAYNGAIGAITGAPTGSSASATSATLAAYSNGNYYRDVTSTWGLAAGNLSGGITAFLLGIGRPGFGASAGQRQFQVGILSGGTGAIPKDGTVQLALGWRHSWARR